MTDAAAETGPDDRSRRWAARAAAALVAGVALWRLWQVADRFHVGYRWRWAHSSPFSVWDILAPADLAAGAVWLLALGSASFALVATVRWARYVGPSLVGTALLVLVAASMVLARDWGRIFRFGNWFAARPHLIDLAAAVACPLALAARWQSAARRRVAVAVLLVATLMAMVAVEVLARRQRRIGTNESFAIGFLRSLSVAQAVLQQARVVDQDRDGEGEYGWLAEFLGHATPRVGPAQPPEAAWEPPWKPLQPAGISRSGHAWINSGYCFLLYLPTAAGRAQAEPATGAIAVAAADAPLQRLRWACYAWPYDAGWSGNRMFFVNDAGDVFCTTQRTHTFSGPDDPPPPEAAYDMAGPDPDNLDAGIGLAWAGRTAGDGNEWMPAGG